MTFSRRVSQRWHKEVPGSRWFRTDLHLHTLDDHPNPRLKRPADAQGDVSNPETQRAYARAFLRCAVARGIEVLGLTPHAVRCANSDESCATWRIVETWNSEDDDDGIPFRDKIYAVFPGFEPSLSDGSRGVHLLFLFDPEIGRDCFLRAFQGVMGGVSPWNGNQLRNTGLNAAQVFAALDRLQREENHRWHFLCLAPHAFNNEKGLFDLRSQILQDFPSQRLSGLELGDNQLPEEVLGRRAWLGPSMSELGHGFFHASDAYEVCSDRTDGRLYQIGSRFTMVKLASPTIEALRQAFLASDSRIRIAYQKDEAGNLVERSDLPDPRATGRPWLRKLSISGGSSFFGGNEGSADRPRTTEVCFSPDLTCIVGSRMSGKSTLLDGMRIFFGHPLPQDRRVREDVEGRGRQLAAGGAVIQPDISGRSDPTLTLSEQWPAVFFTQRELQDAVRNQEGLRHILYRLLPGRAEALIAEDKRLEQIDRELSEAVAQAVRARSTLADAEQDLARAQAARDALQRFRDAGAERLVPAQRDQSMLAGALEDLHKLQTRLADAVGRAAALEIPTPAGSELREVLERSAREAQGQLQQLTSHLQMAVATSDALRQELEGAVQTASDEVMRLRSDVERAIIAAGGQADELFQFDRLSAAAGEFDKKALVAERLGSEHDGIVTGIRTLAGERDALAERHRQVMREVLETIERRFEGKIRLRIEPEGDLASTGGWVRDLREAGLTRWWNDTHRDGDRALLSPRRIAAALDADTLTGLEMSPRVASRFKELMQEEQHLQLIALRARDLYVLELHVGPGPQDYREMSKLSGGQQVSLLLSLLLETNDPGPLIIDQPEDELDSSYLFDTVLPALRRLKGRRQIIFATHSANIVVNGDADHVVHLAGTYDHATVQSQGAIEEPPVKHAILTTVDGGKAAFQLRHRKYGF